MPKLLAAFLALVYVAGCVRRSVIFMSTDWFNLATGEALAEYNPSPAVRELVAGVESQRADPHLSESAEKSVISFSPTQQSTHVNAVRNALVARQLRSATHLVARQRGPQRIK